jgi:hypothetical protein
LNLRILINNYRWFKFKSLHDSSLHVRTKKTTQQQKNAQVKKHTKGLAPLPQLLFYLLPVVLVDWLLAFLPVACCPCSERLFLTNSHSFALSTGSRYCRALARATTTTRMMMTRTMMTRENLARARERVALARATMMRADKDDSKVRVALDWQG